MSDREVTSAVAAFVADFDAASLPRHVRDKALDHIVDGIGCALAGSATGVARRIVAATAAEARPGPCRVLGTRYAFGPAASAFANAATLNALDFDDGLEDEHGRGMGHPGSSIVAAGLSACFERPVPGAAFITAIALAYEVNNRLARAMQPSAERVRQVHGVCQHQSIGAALVYGRLAELRGEELENAMGFAGTLATVPSLHKYNWRSRPLASFKDFAAPAAEAGVRGVRFHQAGLDGAKGVLDGSSGLWRMLGSDRFEPERLTEGLGHHWTLDFNTIKPYPTCRWMHPILDAFEALLADHAVDADAIAGIVVQADAALLGDFMDADPTGITDAQFSFPHALAALSLRINPARWYSDETMVDPRLSALAARVSGAVDPEASAVMARLRLPAGRVAIRLRDGTDLDSRFAVDQPGGRRRPLGAGAVDRKFLANLRTVMPDARARALLTALRDLDGRSDVAAIL